MKFNLEVTMNNAAFEDMPGDELARILRKVADDVSGYTGGDDRGRARDSNGSTVACYTITEG